MENTLLGTYQNGNYTVSIFEDGTKIRENDLDHFSAAFPECMDVKITDYCDMGCPYCHENSTKEGLHGDILSPVFWDTLKPYTEIALGGGNPLSHPRLVDLLELLKNKQIIANLTVNQQHFLKDQVLIRKLVDSKLIRGLGVSITGKTTPELANLLTTYPNAVLHVINGIVDVQNTLKPLYGKGLKLLILGYKTFRKGIEYHSPEVERKKQELSRNLMRVLMGFDVVSFDNLAIIQLNVKNYMSEDKWNEFYMGDDGQFTMYIDLVKQEFARCSIATTRYNLLPHITDMFKQVKNESH